jgi:hypothetical protein
MVRAPVRKRRNEAKTRYVTLNWNAANIRCPNQAVSVGPDQEK